MAEARLTRRAIQTLRRRMRFGFMGTVLGVGIAVCVGSILIYGPHEATPAERIGASYGSADRSADRSGGQSDRRLSANSSNHTLHACRPKGEVRDDLPSCDCSLGNYPPEVFNWEQKKGGAVALYVLGVLYMFVALAIVCDEFFVPALERIVEVAGISDDVGEYSL